MATLFGLCSNPVWLTRNVGTNPRILGGLYNYRRDDNYYLAFSNLSTYFGPTAPSNIIKTTSVPNSDGSVVVDYATFLSSTPTAGGFGQWATISGDIASNDPRVTYSLDASVTTATMFSDVPTRRWEGNQFFLVTTASVNPARTNTWQFKPPLPLRFSFDYSGSTYTVRARIPSDNITFPDSGGNNGRFVHLETYYPPGTAGAMCGVDGTTFSTLAQEQAHNSLAFTLDGGATSRTFNNTESVVSLPLSMGGSLVCSSNSEVAGTSAARAFYPAIMRATGEFLESGRLRVDMTSSVSPTATVTGVFVRDASTPASSGRPSAGSLRPYIDHYEVNGATVATVSSGSGDYVPATVFDIVFKESETARTGYLQLRGVVDAPGLPPLDDTLALNWQMSIPALLYAVVTMAPPVDAGIIVRFSGRIKRRADSQLWQHRGESRMWAGEPKTGAVYASDDEGTTWNLMANAWSDISGAKPLGFASLPFKGAISIAQVGTNVQSRYSPDGKTWQTPKTVCPFVAGKWAVASYENSGSDEVNVMNLTTEVRYRTFNRGTTWEVAT